MFAAVAGVLKNFATKVGAGVTKVAGAVPEAVTTVAKAVPEAGAKGAEAVKDSNLLTSSVDWLNNQMGDSEFGKGFRGNEGYIVRDGNGVAWGATLSRIAGGAAKLALAKKIATLGSGKDKAQNIMASLSNNTQKGLSSYTDWSA
jgi:hypothetical protein